MQAVMQLKQKKVVKKASLISLLQEMRSAYKNLAELEQPPPKWEH